MVIDHLEDTLDDESVIFTGDAWPKAKCRLTVFGHPDEVEYMSGAVSSHPDIREFESDTLIDESKATCETFLFRTFRVEPLLDELQKINPEVMMLLSWGYPLQLSDRLKIRDDGTLAPDECHPHRGGRAIIFRWESFISNPKCPLTMGENEERKHFLYRIHLWGMEFHRTHHQYKQGVIDATNIQMV